MHDLDAIVRELGLSPHPEGGFYRETYRAPLRVPTDRGERAAATAIHFLLTRTAFSALHRIRSDEVWCFHSGDPVRVVVLDEGGERADHVLGLDLASGQRPQAVVPAGAWFGALLEPGDAPWSLVSCMVAPGFDFEDFELARRADMLGRFPQHAGAIEMLTRG